MITLYTDGSSNPVYGIGAWVAILQINTQKIILSEMETLTTHQRMELTAVIKAMEYLNGNNHTTEHIELYTDSQYVAGIPTRREKFKKDNFLTLKHTPIRNDDLVKKLIGYIDALDIRIIKIKAHQKKAAGVDSFNQDADRLARKIVRDAVCNNVMQNSTSS